jgi:hypothetical protein
LKCGEKYNPKTNMWSRIPDMSKVRLSMTTAVIDDKIFVIGGDGIFNPTNRVEYFNEEEYKWFVYS